MDEDDVYAGEEVVIDSWLDILDATSESEDEQDEEPTPILRLPGCSIESKEEEALKYRNSLYRFLTLEIKPSLLDLMLKEFVHADYFRRESDYEVLGMEYCPACTGYIYSRSDASISRSLSSGVKNVQKYPNLVGEAEYFYDFLKEVCKKKPPSDQQGKKPQKRNSSSRQLKRVSVEVDKGTNQINHLSECMTAMWDITINDVIYCNRIKCDKMRDLHYTFFINILLNRHIGFNLCHDIFKAINGIKELKNIIDHQPGSALIETFSVTLDTLFGYLKILKRHNNEDTNLEKLYSHYKEMPTNVHDMKKIFTELRDEIMMTYNKFEPVTVHPNLRFIKKDTNDYSPTIYYDRRSKLQSETIVGLPYKDLSTFLPTYIDSLKEKVFQVPKLLLSGDRSSGKTSCVNTLCYNWTQIKELQKKIPLIIYLQEMKGGDIQEIIKCRLSSLVPETVEKYGIDMTYASVNAKYNDVLYISDINISGVSRSRYDANISLIDKIKRGLWLFTGSASINLLRKWDILQIESFTKQQVTELLRALNANSPDVNTIIENYVTNNDVQKHINTPGLILIFNKVHQKSKLCKTGDVIKNYIEDISASFKSDSSDMKKIRKLAFDDKVSICSTASYSYNKVKKISPDIRCLFLKNIKDDEYEFLHHNIEDFLAAQHVIYDPEYACKQWVKFAFRCKHVFKYAVYIWNEQSKLTKKNSDSQILDYINKYFLALFDCSDSVIDDSGIDETTIKDNCKKQFTAWGFLDHIDEACECIPTVKEIIACILQEKNVWVFKCKYFNEDRIKTVLRYIKKVKIHKDKCLIIHLISDLEHAKILRTLWNEIRNLENLHDQCWVKISFMQNRIPLPDVTHELSSLLYDIKENISNMYILDYTGPFITSKVTNIFQCESMKLINSLNVIILDFKSLKEVLSYKHKLSSLKICINLYKFRQEENDYIDLTDLPTCSQLKVKVKMHGNGYGVSDWFKSADQIQTLNLSRIDMTEQRIDLIMFKHLERLVLRHCVITPSHSISESFKSKPLQSILERINVPPNLYSVILKNMRLLNDENISNIFGLPNSPTFSRLILMDTKITICGISKLIENNILHKLEKLNIDPTEEHWQETKLISRLLKPRMSVNERDAIRRNKREGKELIVLSNWIECDSESVHVWNDQQLRAMSEFIVILYENESLNRFSFSNIFMSIDKSTCGDVDIMIPLKMLDDQCLNILKSEEFDQVEQSDFKHTLKELWNFLRVLVLVNRIIITHTNLSLDGAKELVTMIKNSKITNTQTEDIDPFCLTISSYCCPKSTKDVRNTTFIHFIKNEDKLSQFLFKSVDKLPQFHSMQIIKKTIKGKIILDGDDL